MIAILTEIQRHLVLRRLRKGRFVAKSERVFETSELFLIDVGGYQFNATLLILEPCRGEVVRPIGVGNKFIDEAYDYDDHVAESLWLAATIRKRAKDRLYEENEETW